jgi:hypothetical protein
MLTGIHLENFQGFKGFNECRLAPITLIFGPNASGKSSFRRALESIRLALSDDAQTYSESAIHKKIEYLSYGWSPAATERIPFGFGISISGSARGATQSANLVASKVRHQFWFSGSSNEATIEQSITFVPGQKPEILGFVFNFDVDRFTSKDVEILVSSLSNLAGALDDIENPEEDLSTINARVKSLGVNSERTRQVIQQFNQGQDYVTFTQAGFPKASKVSAWAKLLVGFLSNGIDSIMDKTEKTQIFSYNLVQEKFELEGVGWHFHEFTRSKKNDDPGSEVELVEYLDDEIAERLAREILTAGFLLDWNIFYGEEDPYWREEGFGGKDAVVWNIQKAIYENSHSLKNLMLREFKAIEPLRGVPAEEAFGEAKELPTPLAVKKMNEILSRITNSRYQFQFRNEISVRTPRNRQTVLDTYTGVEVPFSDVGTGLSQLLPILLDLSLRDDGLTYVEQPELHLHPKAQSDLMDAIVDSWLDCHRNEGLDRQFILETHSESMLLRLQKRIRRGDLKSSDVSILFVDAIDPKTAKDGKGHNQITELAIDHFGDVIDPFPVSFVDLRIQDLLN